MAAPLITPTEISLHKKWQASSPLKKVLAIRFHALGDVVITLPYLQALKNGMPNVDLHFLTREEFADIPRSAAMFSKVFSIDDKRNPKILLAKSLTMLPQFLVEQYGVVLDLQRNSVSRLLRRLLFPKSYSEFDRYSALSAGERVRHTINLLELHKIEDQLPAVELKNHNNTDDTWKSSGYSREIRYIILNPAGSSPSKNWPIENYVRFAELWSNEVDDTAKFLVIGTERMVENASYLQREMREIIVNLVGLTTPSEAMSLIKQSRLVLTEDSAVMHMAWVSKIPLVALFGSTPSVWSRPLGDSSVLLDSADLECGCCNQPLCRFGDVHCLTRHSPESVVKVAAELFSKTASNFPSR